MRAWRGLEALGLCATLLASPAGALDLRAIAATYRDGVFHVTFEALLNAPASGIEAVLTDYGSYALLDPRIHRAESVGRQADGAVLLHTTIDVCAGVFCRSVERVERIERQPDGLLATILPERSDLRRGVASTHWSTQGTQTVVAYDAEFQADFWVPGIVGRLYATKALRESTLQLFGNVERRARGR